MKTNDKNSNSIAEILEKLDKMQYDLMHSCNKNCRYAASSLIGSTWVLIIGKNVNSSMVIHNPRLSLISDITLIIALSCSVLFILFDAWRQYRLAEKIRKLHEDNLLYRRDDVETIFEANNASDESVRFFKYQMLLCLFAIIALFVFILSVFYSNHLMYK